MDTVARAQKRPAAGNFPQGSRAGVYGSTAYPSVIEQYDRTGDYKRWKLGQAYAYSMGRGWGDYQVHSLARFVGGAVDATSKDIVTAFPSRSSPERAWWCALRTRGSVILPEPITSDRMRLDQSDPDPAMHRLVLDVSGMLSTQQLQVWRVFLGDQFEDSASGARYPDDLIARPVGSIALTLVGVNVSAMELVFDLSRPQGRVVRRGGSSRSERVYQSRLPYTPAEPLIFNGSGSRYLCSSLKFFCCCPDHLGGAVANLEQPASGGLIDRVPLPNAGRPVRSAWEREGASYYRQWRSLSDRIDERRECKHIHALRWQCGVPWLEPSDYPSEGERDLLPLASELEARRDPLEALSYFQLRGLSLDRYILSLAEVVGLTLFPGGDVRDGQRPDARPLLWNDGAQPLASWSRQNDWWCPRGSNQLKIFNSTSATFEDTIEVGGIRYPVVENLAAGAAGAPVVVP